MSWNAYGTHFCLPKLDEKKTTTDYIKPDNDEPTVEYV